MYKIAGKILLLINLGLAIGLGIAEILTFFIKYNGEFGYRVILMVCLNFILLIGGGILGLICVFKRKNMGTNLSFAVCVIFSCIYYFYRAASFEYARNFFLIFGILSTVIAAAQAISILVNKEELKR